MDKQVTENGTCDKDISRLAKASIFTYEDVQEIAKFIEGKVKCRPKLGIICGSGLGKLVDLVEDKEEVHYSKIPGFPVSTVPGHDGKLVFGKLSGKPVCLMKGRAHAYEGYLPQKITLPVRVMHMMGITTLFVTNAAGGVNRDFNVGDIMIIKDHVNLAGFAGVNPLVGANDERFGPRFPAMSQAYDKDIREAALKKAKDMDMEKFTRQGVYSMMVGPNFETIAECKLLHTLGIDATGMSTVPEVLVAKHCGMRVFGMSLITNVVVMEYDSPSVANHKEVLETGEKRSKDLQKLVEAIVKDLDL